MNRVNDVGIVVDLVDVGHDADLDDVGLDVDVVDIDVDLVVDGSVDNQHSYQRVTML